MVLSLPRTKTEQPGDFGRLLYGVEKNATHRCA
jgi:hypothetical protein